MKFWKEHVKLRVTLITLFFLAGLFFVFTGWKMTGELPGLLIMMLGVSFLLVALSIYNKAFES